MYYGNLWSSQSFPFLSQLLYNGSSNATNFVEYNQSLVLNSKFEIDEVALASQSLPYLTGTYIVYLITSNMGITAALVHMALWNYDDIKEGWSFAHPSNIKKLFLKETWVFWKNQETPDQRLARKINDPDLDPHYKLMLKNKYQECPQWWWGTVLILSFFVGLGCLYAMRVRTPKWFLNRLANVTLISAVVNPSMVGLYHCHAYYDPVHSVPRSPDGFDRFPV